MTEFVNFCPCLSTLTLQQRSTIESRLFIGYSYGPGKGYVTKFVNVHYIYLFLFLLLIKKILPKKGAENCTDDR